MLPQMTKLVESIKQKAPKILPVEDLASKAQIYENYLLLTKNDINLDLLKEFKYTTKTRSTKSGRDQTVYVCIQDGCDKEFLRTCNLLDHCRMHNGIKPNLCKFCNKSFTQKSNLTKHLKVHQKPELTDRKRYPCSKCKAAYTERYNLKKHMDKAHDGDEVSI
mmetsp:Transcript_1557/g.1370  ORF Transcript_1557/g.1370 Transcript_1557/m.1370 type:complete len:163 (+) Transcript_1557:557-1045(+)